MRLQAVLRRDRAVVAGVLAGAVAASWVAVLAGVGTGMPALDMTGWPTAAGTMPSMRPAVWTAGYAGLMLLTWWLMMLAMMLPSAAPMILIHAALARRPPGPASHASTAAFVAGYLTMWGVFSIAAVALQWALSSVAVLSPEMVITSTAVGGALLVAAGGWQLTPLKHACLRHCRAPFAFIMQHWRPGALGGWRMGLVHGAYCLGCCWVLMLLLFYGGMMNVYWIAGLSVLVLAEKTVPAGHWLGTLIGLALIGWGVALLASLA
ncbi:MAG: DUF2182 domain-containing protein [Rhodospirillaceae bacterium]|nr:DUF2182 domain-containing protein [Rhodospirillaceae bacterium]